MVIFDVKKLELDENEKLEFRLATAKHFDSNFWIKAKTIGLITWVALFLVATYISYKTFGRPETLISRWVGIIFLFLHLIDFLKDPFYLFVIPHNFWITLGLSQSIIIPFVMNVWTTNTI